MSFPTNPFPSPVEDILKKPNFTLQDLLDEDETVVETRNQKQELIEFLIKKENIEQLVSYVVDEPPPEAETNVKFRYPVVSCEILSSEINDIEQVFLSMSYLLDRLFSFFSQPHINLLRVNLVIKIAKAITTSKMETMFTYLTKNPQYIDWLINHLEAAAVPEFFTRLISIDGEAETVTTQRWLAELDFVEKIIGKLGPDLNLPDVTQAIMDVMTASPWGTPLMNRISSEATALLLLKNSLDPRNPRAFRYCMKVFVRLLKVLSMAQEGEPDSDEEEDKPRYVKPDPLSPLEKLPAPVRVLVGNLEKFCGLLKKPLAPQMVIDQTNRTYESFGFDRLAILELVEALLGLGYSAVQAALLHSEFFPIAFDLVFQFPHNTFCHKSVESLTIKFLEQSSQETQVKFQEKVQLAKKLVGAEKLKEEKVSPLAHLHRLANVIGQIAEKSTNFKASLEETEGWKEYIEVIVEERKKLEIASQIVKGEEELPFFQSSAVSDLGEFENDTYEEGRDGDDADLSLSDDQDMDSANDADDYDPDQAEILLTKQEIESFA